MNLQNLPRGDKTIKRAFVPKLDCFLFADYSSIEYRILAYYAAKFGDSSLADEFARGLDPHTVTAARLFHGEGALLSLVTEEERQKAKTLNYAVMFLGGAPTITKQLGIGYEEALVLLNEYHKARPQIRMVDGFVQKTLEDRGYIKTIAGRHLHPPEARKALNSLIQGSAAELIRDAMRRAAVFCEFCSLRSHLVVCVHDELGFDCDQDEVLTLAKELPNIMGNEEIESVVPIEIDLGYSETNWGAKEAIEIVDTGGS